MRALLSVGHDASTVRDLEATRLTDDTHLLTAARERRVLVTHDRNDFTLLHDAWLTWPAAFGLALPPRPGIVVLDPAPHDALFHALDAFLARTVPETWPNQLYRWHHRDEWHRRVAANRWESFHL
jgi:hypothetical protein